MKHHPTRFQIQAFEQALREARESCPEFTPAHMQFLAQRRDRFLAMLKEKTHA